MAILVYKLINATNGKAYIGITSRSLDMRWLEHCARARQGVRESRLYAAMRKYGEQSFSREIVTTCETPDEARSLEKHFILHFDTYANGYNANEGGHGWLHVPESVRRKSAETQRGKVISAECRAKMSAAKIGRSECADNFGAHTRKGSENPRSIVAVVGFPNGDIRRVHGLRSFCREVGIDLYKFKKRNSVKGYALLGKFPPAAETANAT